MCKFMYVRTYVCMYVCTYMYVVSFHLSFYCITSNCRWIRINALFPVWGCDTHERTNKQSRTLANDRNSVLDLYLFRFLLHARVVFSDDLGPYNNLVKMTHDRLLQLVITLAELYRASCTKCLLPIFTLSNQLIPVSNKPFSIKHRSRSIQRKK